MVDSVFYGKMAATALRLIQLRGRADIVMTRKSNTAYDPGEDSETAAANVTQTVTCVVLPMPGGASSDGLEAGTAIAANMRELKIAASGLTFVPAAGDSVEFDSARWILLGCTPISPAGIPLLYVASVKRG